MAKDQNNENEAGGQQIQEPEPPPKKKKGLSLPLIIGISFAALLILIGGTLGAVYLMVNNMMQHTNTEQTSNESEKQDSEDDEEKSDEFDLKTKYAELQDVVDRQTKNVHFLEIGEIITNPKNSGKFVVVDIGVEYVAYDENGEVIQVNTESETSHELFDKKDMAKVRSVVNEVVWSNNETELQNKRSELPGILKKKFKDIFLDNGAVIKDVVILRFIIQ